jgi:hypothetical protein
MVSNVFFAMLLFLNTQEKLDNDTIYPFVGVGEFRLDKTTFQETKKSNPNAQISKYRYFYGFFWLGETVKMVILEDRGLVLFFKKKNRRGKYYLSSIRMCQGFKGETLGGVKIGSSYLDVAKEFGEDRILAVSVNGSLYYSISYSNFKGKQGYRGDLFFYCFDKNVGNSNFVVERIEISAP